MTYVGVDDPDLTLFEGQYPVQPAGVSYNSYVITDQKIAVMDTVDARATDAWLENLDFALDGRTPDYLVISHMEPDHAANIARLSARYPEMKLVGNAKTFAMMGQFFGPDAAPQTAWSPWARGTLWNWAATGCASSWPHGPLARGDGDL